MTFAQTWDQLLESVADLSADERLTTPLSEAGVRVDDVGGREIVVRKRDGDQPVRLERGRFETLCRRVREADDGFDLDRIPSNATAYVAVLDVHPQFEVDREKWALVEAEMPTTPEASDDSLDDVFQEGDTTEPSVAEMIENMGDPRGRVACPIEGCEYGHQSAASVARHVSGSSTAKHVWENTSYSGWRDFVEKHGESPG